MHCPYCQSAIQEYTAECPQCGLSLEKLYRRYGPPAQALLNPVADLTGQVPPKELRRIENAAKALEQRFPQITFRVAIIDADPEMPLPVTGCWLLNSRGIASEMERGGRNRQILFLVDPDTRRAGFTIGYGLEPFIPVSALEKAAGAGCADFSQDQFCEGICAALQALGDQLAERCENLPRA
ncbi:MAG: TPM domain-containing protein [Verrucomicrobiales bacterium]